MKYFKTLFVALSAVCMVATSVFAQNVNDFTIDSFVAEYHLSKADNGYSQLRVKETITADFTNINQNHGIERAIPTKYKQANIGLTIDSVEDEQGNQYQYSTYEQNDNLVVRIGDPDRYVYGKTTYNISYHLKNVVSFFDDHDEFYWDVNGDGWLQTINQVGAKLVLDGEISLSLLEDMKCFTGEYGSTEQACTIENDDGNSVSFTTNRTLKPGENMSIVLGFKPGTFVEDKSYLTFIYLVVASNIVWLCGVSALLYRRWSKYGRDPKSEVIIPQYEPLEDLDIMSADMLLNERFRTEAISAGIISLATQGHIVINHSQESKFLSKVDKYVLELVKPIDEKNTVLYEVASRLFKGNKTGAVCDLSKNQSKLYSTVTKLKKSLPKSLVDNEYYKKNPIKIKSTYFAIGAVMSITGLIVVTIFPALLLSGIVTLFFARLMPARTPKGMAARDYLLGLKKYIELAEADQINYLESPEGAKRYGDPQNDTTKIKLFETLLPYAIIFGLEKNWSKQFQHLYQQPPGWYQSNLPLQQFALLNAINGMSNQSVGAFSPPHSSGGSGFSSGGGFSGGGGGGGGGGGW